MDEFLDYLAMARVARELERNLIAGAVAQAFAEE